MSKIDDIVSMKVDRAEVRVLNNFEERDAPDHDYWRSLTPEERLTALELMRQTYGYIECQSGLQDFLKLLNKN